MLNIERQVTQLAVAEPGQLHTHLLNKLKR